MFLPFAALRAPEPLPEPLMALFGPKRPLGAAEWEWQLAGFRWLLEEFDGLDKHRASLLATPDGACFPDSTLRGDARAEELLRQIMTISEISDWPVRLVMEDGEPELRAVSQMHAITPETGWALGTFQLVDDGEGGRLAEIVASRQQLRDEAALVATLAHEVAHYLLSSSDRPMPGGEDCHELLTDLTAVFLGFGIFLGNSARYAGHTPAEAGQIGGWYLSGSQGYLSERALMSALAISEMLAGRDPMAAVPYLKPHLASDLKHAARYVARRDIAADVMAVDLADYGVPAAGAPS
ncbi:hypothetical protein [Sphingopyxis sp. KK2]|uniref:hypothetical protein n=1 Tax=Sphingopyxis sp. KK2 TaxID=1855727 RepID=UPI00097E7187|nr:hypothetical protein [Sphingopyxis sp. KK2]